jgi:hypothetical protein
MAACGQVINVYNSSLDNVRPVAIIPHASWPGGTCRGPPHPRPPRGCDTTGTDWGRVECNRQVLCAPVPPPIPVSGFLYSFLPLSCCGGLMNAPSYRLAVVRVACVCQQESRRRMVHTGRCLGVESHMDPRTPFRTPAEPPVAGLLVCVVVCVQCDSCSHVYSIICGVSANAVPASTVLLLKGPFALL